MARRTLLLIEDEQSIAEPLQLALEREGFEVVWAATAAAGLEAFRSREPEVVLLDVMLPDGDGRDVLRELRSVSAVPVIMLTARGEEIDRVLGLELGADDYVTKPFSVAEPWRGCGRSFAAATRPSPSATRAWRSATWR